MLPVWRAENRLYCKKNTMKIDKLPRQCNKCNTAYPESTDSCVGRRYQCSPELQSPSHHWLQDNINLELSSIHSTVAKFLDNIHVFVYMVEVTLLGVMMIIERWRNFYIVSNVLSTASLTLIDLLSILQHCKLSTISLNSLNMNDAWQLISFNIKGVSSFPSPL